MNLRLLNAIVREIPPRLNELFGMEDLPEQEKGACVTYSLMLAQVLTEFGIKAKVSPVLIETGNQAYFDLLAGKISQAEAIRIGAKTQIWGEIENGQNYQHAICYIPKWDVIIDLSMERRKSKAVLCHPYWGSADDKSEHRIPNWIFKFLFKDYKLTYDAHLMYPSKIRKGRKIIRKVVRRYIQ